MKRKKTIYNQQYNNLIQELSLERKRLGLSQKEVAESLKMTQSEISKIESSERRIDIWEFKQLLKVYRIKENLKLKQLVMIFFDLEE